MLVPPFAWRATLFHFVPKQLDISSLIAASHSAMTQKPMFKPCHL